MKAAVLFKPNEPLQIVDLRARSAQGRARVRVKNEGLGRLPERLARHERRLALGPLPIVPGHEAGGARSPNAAAGVTTVKPGDHVIFSFRPHCGPLAAYCTQGRTVLCIGRASVPPGRASTTAPCASSTRARASTRWARHRHLRRGSGRAGGDGGGRFSQGHAVAAGGPGRLLRGDRRRAPSRATPKIEAGSTVLVIGCGGGRAERGAGRPCCSGASKIIAADILDNKLEMAKTFGRHPHDQQPATNEDGREEGEGDHGAGLGVDYSFDAVSIEKTQALAFDALAPGGPRRGGRHFGGGQWRALLLALHDWCSPRKTVSGTFYGSVRPDPRLPRAGRTTT